MEAGLETTGLSDSSFTNPSQPLPDTRARPSLNAIEGYKTSKDGNGLRVLDDLPGIIARGVSALTPAEKELLKWVGVFFRRPTPGKFMMRVRMPNGFASGAQLRAVADLARRFGNNVLDITTRRQIELRGFTLDSVPEIWEKLRGVDLRSLQTGIDNIRNINGCALAGLTHNELFDAPSFSFSACKRTPSQAVKSSIPFRATTTCPTSSPDSFKHVVFRANMSTTGHPATHCRPSRVGCPFGR
jgi:hypothetical protein